MGKKECAFLWAYREYSELPIILPVCHTLILDLKILLQNSFLFLILFKFTVFYSTIFYCGSTAYFTVSVSNFLACKTIQSIFLALQVIEEFLKTLHIFLHFIPNFSIKIIQRVFWSFPTVEPILVLTFVSESFQLVCTNHWSKFCLKIISALHLS